MLGYPLLHIIFFPTVLFLDIGDDIEKLDYAH